MTRTLIRPRALATAALAAVLGLGLASCAVAPVAPPLEPSTQPSNSTTPDPNADKPVSAVDLAAGDQDGPVSVNVDGGAEGVGVTFREITIKPGASTGVHCHYGQLIAVVKEGNLTHYAAMYPGGVHVYETGDSIVEGAGYQHEGRNEGTSNVVLWVTYIIPEGKPLAETALENCEQ